MPCPYSSVSRRFVDASEEEYRKLLERRLDDLKLMVIHIDGLVYGDDHIIVAVGVDNGGYKQVLGIKIGSTENSTVVKELLEDMVERGIKPGMKRLFVIDGSKALRKAIDEVYGSDNPVQRCRVHKMRNVLDKLPDHLKVMAQLHMKAAWKLDAEAGISRIKELASMFEGKHASAAASLLEGLEETFTINRLGLPASLRRSLASTNIIESNNSGVRLRTRRVTNWENEGMVERWAASGLLAHEKHFRRISGYRDLWMLKAGLGWDAYCLI